ncbi:LysE family transporter [Saccharospirillum sp. HFRX-1]|uniref:LysE/ArgO family amino acid transporter n=1 Tax=unclassified Saccharospirillum TaxID=2633430 RepID=UPI00371D2ED2
MLSSLMTGFAVSLGLIVAIGAQNAWVLSRSLRGEHRLVLALVCAGVDAVLIVTGVFGLDSVQRLVPALVPVLTWLGVGLLLYLAAQSLLRAWQGNSGLLAGPAVSATGAWTLAGQALAISLLNPHVYLDTVVLIGSVGAQQPAPGWYALGAALASLFWFSALAGLGRYLQQWLRSPWHWRCFDAVIGLVMVAVAVSLLV